jgi:carboxyl-terminal processing protease
MIGGEVLSLRLVFLIGWRILMFKNIGILLICCFVTLTTNAEDKRKTQLLGKLIKNALESYHYRNLDINDDVSKRAFTQLLKNIDFSKQFLLQSDIKKIEKYKSKMDDQMISGDHQVMGEIAGLFQKRVKSVQSYHQIYFAKGNNFNFKKNEMLETDQDKRDFFKTDKELKNYWRKVFKQATLNRYISLMNNKKEELEELKKPKDKKSKKKKDKIIKSANMVKDKKPLIEMTLPEIKVKARVAIAKRYDRYFTRLLKDREEDYTDKFFNSLSLVYDPHTHYLAPKKKEDFDIDISGSLEGIGAVLQEDGSFIKVVKIVPGGAAWREKNLEVGDLILDVSQGEEKEHISLVDMRVDDAVRFIRGKKGTTVNLLVKKADSSRKKISIVRDVVRVGESFVKSSVISRKGLKLKVGYIYVPKFYRDFGNSEKNCTDDVRKELVRLKKQNVNGIILDLRNNGGGALEDAKQMSGLFIKDGPIVQIKDHVGHIEVLKDVDSAVVYSGPLIVMINRFSASASEILAAAMQDYNRAVLVGGEFSHGKGTVQAVLNLNQAPWVNMFGPTLGALKVTIQKFYRVNGGSTQYKGVTPDIILPDPFGYTESREKDLENSLPWDEIKPIKIEKWRKNYLTSMDLLKTRSKNRVKKESRFKRITESVSYLKKKMKETAVSLNIDKVLAEDKLAKNMTEKLKNDKPHKDIIVTNYEASLKSAEKIKKEDRKKWKKDFEQRKEEWVTTLQKDAGLEEAIFIMNDLLQINNGKKLSMVP